MGWSILHVGNYGSCHHSDVYCLVRKLHHYTAIKCGAHGRLTYGFLHFCPFDLHGVSALMLGYLKLRSISCEQPMNFST